MDATFYRRFMEVGTLITALCAVAVIARKDVALAIPLGAWAIFAWWEMSKMRV